MAELVQGELTISANPLLEIERPTQKVLCQPTRLDCPLPLPPGLLQPYLKSALLRSTQHRYAALTAVTFRQFFGGNESQRKYKPNANTHIEMNSRNSFS